MSPRLADPVIPMLYRITSKASMGKPTRRDIQRHPRARTVTEIIGSKV
jgi:hypothetical protein